MRILEGIVSIAVLCAIAGCGAGAGGGAGAIPAAHDDGNPASDPSWELLYTASCAGIAAESCQGAYGFALNNDGSYEVGPGPRGESVTGLLGPRDFEELRARFAALHLSRFGEKLRSPACKPPAPGQGASVLLRLGRRGSARTLVSDAAGTLCLDTALVVNDDGARELESWVTQLAAKYSPVTFPDPCVEAASALQRSYAGLQRCSQDSDCAYLDENLLPIESASNRSVVVDDCSYVTPIAVANEFLAVTSQRELLLQRDLVRRICAPDPVKPFCTRRLSFDPAIGSPVCRESVCQLNPKVERGFEP